MVDQRTHSDSEQVLNSVRRLVAARPEQQADSPAERLLLTPSLRVNEASDPAPAGTTDVPLHLGSADSLEARIAELEAAVSRQNGEFEPDGSEEIDEETPDRFVFTHTPRDAVEDAHVLEDEPESVNESDVGTAEEPATSDDRPDNRVELSDDMVIDEEMLRDLVSEIVRSELQGELGERITRNVRKLVRREIHRAIMTRDFG